MVKFSVLFVFLYVFQIASAQNADIVKSDAIMADERQEYAKAAGLYEQAAKLYEEQGKTDTFCIFKAGQNYVRAKDYNKGVNFLEKAKELNYDDIKLYVYLASGYDGLKKYDLGEKTLLEGLEKYPDEKALFLKKLVYHYSKARDYKKTVDAVDKALQYYPGDTKMLLLKGNSLLSMKMYDEAIDVFKRVEEAEPGNFKAVSKLGVAMFKKTEDRYQKEVKRYKQMKNPSRVDYSNYRKKIEQISTGYKNALPYLEKARTQKPKDKLVLNCLMVSYSRLGMKEKAAEVKSTLGL